MRLNLFIITAIYNSPTSNVERMEFNFDYTGDDVLQYIRETVLPENNVIVTINDTIKYEFRNQLGDTVQKSSIIAMWIHKFLYIGKIFYQVPFDGVHVALNSFNQAVLHSDTGASIVDVIITYMSKTELRCQLISVQLSPRTFSICEPYQKMRCGSLLDAEIDTISHFSLRGTTQGYQQQEKAGYYFFILSTPPINNEQFIPISSSNGLYSMILRLINEKNKRVFVQVEIESIDFESLQYLKFQVSIKKVIESRVPYSFTPRMTLSQKISLLEHIYSEYGVQTRQFVRLLNELLQSVTIDDLTIEMILKLSNFIDLSNYFDRGDGQFFQKIFNYYISLPERQSQQFKTHFPQTVKNRMTNRKAYQLAAADKKAKIQLSKEQDDDDLYS